MLWWVISAVQRSLRTEMKRYVTYMSAFLCGLLERVWARMTFGVHHCLCFSVICCPALVVLRLFGLA